MAWYNFFSRTPPSPPVAESPKQKSLMSELYNKISENEPFTFVCVVVERGDVGFISDLVGGKSTKMGIGVVTGIGKQQKVYDALERLALAPFASSIRCGHAHYSGDLEGMKPTKLIYLARDSYVEKRYEGRTTPQQLQEGLGAA